MRRLLVLATLGGAALLAAGTAGATSECNGLKACVRVAGPWVLAPGRAETRWELSCPKHFVVGGLDAELTAPALDVEFLAALGSPVNPGISTSRAVVFVGRLVAGGEPAATFRPHIGCIPTRAGKQRVPTSRRRVYPPGAPAVVRASVFGVRAGATRRVTRACPARERLVTSSDAIGFYTAADPSPGVAGAVHVARSTARGRVAVTIRGSERVRGVRAAVQLDLLCARVG